MLDAISEKDQDTSSDSSESIFEADKSSAVESSNESQKDVTETSGDIFVKQPTEATKGETKVEDGPGLQEPVKQESKKVYTQQEKIDHAFAEVKAKSQKKIQSLETEIEALKKQITKPLPKKEEFKTEDEYFDARAEVGAAKVSLTSREKELEAEQKDLNAQKAQARFEAQYTTPEMQQRFQEAWNIGSQNGAIRAIHDDSVVGSFLSDSDLSPKMIEHFCRKPEALKAILDIQNESRKQMELYSLEQRMKNFLRSKNVQNPSIQSKPTANTVAPVKAKIPILGSQQKATSNKGSASDFASDEEVFNFIRGI